MHQLQVAVDSGQLLRGAQSFQKTEFSQIFLLPGREGKIEYGFAANVRWYCMPDLA